MFRAGRTGARPGARPWRADIGACRSVGMALVRPKAGIIAPGQRLNINALRCVRQCPRNVTRRGAPRCRAASFLPAADDGSAPKDVTSQCVGRGSLRLRAGTALAAWSGTRTGVALPWFTPRPSRRFRTGPPRLELGTERHLAQSHDHAFSARMQIRRGVAFSQSCPPVHHKQCQQHARDHELADSDADEMRQITTHRLHESPTVYTARCARTLSSSIVAPAPLATTSPRESTT